MTTTTSLEITHMESGPLQPEVTVNAGFNILDKATAGRLVHDFDSDADYSLTNTDSDKEWHYAFMEFTDTGTNLTTGRSVIYPDELGPIFLFRNSTAQVLTVKRSGQTGVDVQIDEIALLYHNGTDIVNIIDQWQSAL